MLDLYNRNINYLRISVTDRCNLRCQYCMPSTGIQLIEPSKILSFEEITHIAQTASELGITKIRLTGGEPLVRRDIITLVGMLRKIPGITELNMTTNGILLETWAKPLFDIGLNRLNISLDTLDPQTYKTITRGGDLSRVLAGIEAAMKVGFTPIKINCVINQTPDEKDARAVALFAKDKGLESRFIKKMDLQKGNFWKIQGGTGGNCQECNRLRLTSDGIIKPCLFNDLGFPTRNQDIREVLLKAIKAKPPLGQSSLYNKFYFMGG